jgi:hypothetical protein
MPSESFAVLPKRGIGNEDLHPVTNPAGCGGSGILFLDKLSAAIVGKRSILRETRPWSANGGRGELSHYALDDRHEGGAKSSARGAVGLGRIVPDLLVSALHFRVGESA